MGATWLLLLAGCLGGAEEDESTAPEESFPETAEEEAAEEEGEEEEGEEEEGEEEEGEEEEGEEEEAEEAGTEEAGTEESHPEEPEAPVPIDDEDEESGGPGSEIRREAPQGTLERAAIERVMRENARTIQGCYEAELGSNPTLEGQVNVDLVIEPDGSVSEAMIASTTLNSRSVEICVRQAVTRFRFPAPDGGSVRITFPFDFAPGG